MNTASNSNDTFFGGRSAAVALISGASQSIKVRQLLLSDYQTAIPLMDDEFAITAFCCELADAPGKPMDKTWIQTLQPESYEKIHSLAKDVNAQGFFSFATRHREKEQAENEKWVRAAGDLPPEFLERAIELGRSRNTAPRPR